MKKIIILFFICLFFIYCSRIGFYAKDADQRFLSDQALQSLMECETKECEERKKESPFFQGSKSNKPGYLTEYFKISKRDKLEILLVVDVSGSMDDNLQEVGRNLQSLLSYIKDKAWKIAFTTADHGDHDPDDLTSAARWEDYNGSSPGFGKLMKLEKGGRILDTFVLDKNTEGYENIFRDTLTRDNSNCDLPPYCQGLNEQPLRSLKAAISRYETDSENNSFFESNADTVALLITDEDERRKDHKNATTAESVIQTFNKVFEGEKKRLFGFSISIQDEDCFKTEIGLMNVAAYGRIIGRLAELTGGKNISLCEEDYGLALQDISKITKALEHSIVLQKIFYIPNTVRISLYPPQPHVSWEFYGRKVVFSGELEPDTQIIVDYQYEQ